MHFFNKRKARRYQEERQHELTLQEQSYLRTYRETVSPEKKTRVYLHQTGFDRQFSRYYQCTLDDSFSYYLTSDASAAEVIVFINTIEPSIVLPNQKVILFFHEPLAYAHLYQTELDDNFAIEHGLEVITHLPTAKPFIRSGNPGRVHRTIPYVHFHHHADRRLIHQLAQGNRDKLVCTITSGLSGIPGYDQRRRFIEGLTEANPAFDLYGRYSKVAASIKSYRGECALKWQTLKDYKFNLVIENSVEDWYISEKIFDSLICGCFPIYHGSSKVFDLLPSDCFYYLPELDSRSWSSLNDFLRDHRDGIKPQLTTGYIYQRFSFYNALESILLGKALQMGA
jgi:hypothetical protein